MDYTPINFGISTANPIEGYLQGLKDRASLNLANAQTNQANAQTGAYTQKSIADNLKAEAEAQRQALMQRVLSPNASIDDLKAFALSNGDNTNALKMYEQKTAEQKTAIIAPANQASSAFYHGNIDLGKEILQEQSDALKNTGDDYNAGLFSAYINYIDKLGASIPKEQLGHIMSNLIDSQIVQVPNGDKIVEARRGKVQADIDHTKTQANQAKALTDKAKEEFKAKRAENLYYPQKTGLDLEKIKADIENTRSQIEQKKYEQENPKLSTQAETLINDNVQKINANNQTINTISSVKNAINQMGGIWTKGSDFVSRFFGAEGEGQLIKSQLAQINFDKIKQNKLAGSVSDSDLRFLQTTVLSPDADSNVIKKYLDITEKVIQTDNKIKQNEVDWVSANGGLGNAKRDLEINGVYIPAGTRFSDFIKTPITQRRYMQYGKQ